MFRIVDTKVIIRFVAVATAILSFAVYHLGQALGLDFSPTKILPISGSVALGLILLITVKKTSRWIWRLLRKLEPSMYPDLTGSWHGVITTETGQEIPAKATIHQSLIQTHINIFTESSKSLTLETTPARDCGEAKLYYAYRSIPKDPRLGSYSGFTIFDVLQKDTALELSGIYFTQRKTIGRIVLRQVNQNTSSNMSFY